MRFTFECFHCRQLFSHLPSSIQAIVCTATYTDDIKDQMKRISHDVKYVTAKIIESNVNDSESITSNVLIGIKQYVASVFKDSTSLDNIRIRRKLLDILLNFEYDQCFVFVNYVSM